MNTNFRSPTAADIGKTVEVSHDNAHWTCGRLVQLSYLANGIAIATDYAMDDGRGTIAYHSFCRVPYTCPDPIAELSMAADLLADMEANEAARVLMERVALLQQMHKMTDMAETATFTEYQSAYNQMRRQIMESLSIPKSLLTPNTEPQP